MTDPIPIRDLGATDCKHCGATWRSCMDNRGMCCAACRASGGHRATDPQKAAQRDLPSMSDLAADRGWTEKKTERHEEQAEALTYERDGSPRVTEEQAAQAEHHHRERLGRLDLRKAVRQALGAGMTKRDVTEAVEDYAMEWLDSPYSDGQIDPEPFVPEAPPEQIDPRTMAFVATVLSPMEQQVREDWVKQERQAKQYDQVSLHGLTDKRRHVVVASSACKRCGNLVWDRDRHDADHDERDAT